MTWRELAMAICVTEVMLKEWRLENSLISEQAFKKLEKPNGFHEYVKKRLPENWGQAKGGKNSSGTTKQISTPPNCQELAELIGIILGDGNVHKVKKGKHVGVYSVRICGHSTHDYVYLNKFIRKLFKELFHIKTTLSKSKRSNAIYLTAYSKKLVQYFESEGLTHGNKVQNQPIIPKWIMTEPSFLAACIRGLIDTDGSIYRMSRKDPHLLRIGFKNHNKRLLKQVKAALSSLGFHPSKIIRDNHVALSRKSDIKAYLQTIGFNNEKHKKRLQRLAP